jgi:hypothetical protein
LPAKGRSRAPDPALRTRLRVRVRGAEKDYYDLVHVLLYKRAGGPAQAGSQLGGGQFAEDVSAARNLFREIEARFSDPSDYAAQSYARQALRVDPEADPAQLAQDAVGAIAEFIAALSPLAHRGGPNV